eukprot:1472432-Pyramimonas_sp.AAC.1
MHEKCSKRMPPDNAAGTPAGVIAGAPDGADDTAEKFDILISTSGSSAHGTGIRTPPSLEKK